MVEGLGVNCDHGGAGLAEGVHAVVGGGRVNGDDFNLVAASLRKEARQQFAELGGAVLHRDNDGNQTAAGLVHQRTRLALEKKPRLADRGLRRCRDGIAVAASPLEFRLLRAQPKADIVLHQVKHTPGAPVQQPIRLPSPVFPVDHCEERRDDQLGGIRFPVGDI